MRIWRLSPRDKIETAFNGEGAKSFGGRWNKKGTPVVYASATLSLCVLEVLAHTDSDLVPDHYVYSIDVPNSVQTETLAESLPQDWQSEPAPEVLQELGSSWAISLRTAILRVPSAIVPAEWNYLINPRHGDFLRLTISRDHLFSFDRRLKG
jgi:RES domain-containing protein